MTEVILFSKKRSVMSNSNQKHSIRLEELNEEVRKKVQKFDVNNDGELSIEEALQTIITLQKQSNNYKKMVYLLIPLVLVTLVGVLGVNVLAIQLTKDLQSSSMNNNAVMVNKDGNVVRTASYNDYGNLFNSIPDLTIEALAEIRQLTFGSYVLPITSAMLGENQVSFSTPFVYFTLKLDKTYTLEFMPGQNVSTNAYLQGVFAAVDASLQELQLVSKVSIINGVMKAKDTRGGPGVVCKSNCVKAR